MLLLPQPCVHMAVGRLCTEQSAEIGLSISVGLAIIIPQPLACVPCCPEKNLPLIVCSDGLTASRQAPARALWLMLFRHVGKKQSPSHFNVVFLEAAMGHFFETPLPGNLVMGLEQFWSIVSEAGSLPLAGFFARDHIEHAHTAHKQTKQLDW